MTQFIDRLAESVRRLASPVVVGLDPRWELIPAGIRGDDDDLPTRAAAFGEFCRGVIDVVAEVVPAVKPQAAFFEQLGPPGMTALADVIAYARQKQLLVILDCKRNDIGSTAEAYADGILGAESAWGADAATVSPYLGDDSLQPFVDTCRARDAGLFVLVKTSNPGGAWLQDRVTDGQPVYRHVAAHVERLASQTLGSCGYGAIGAVVGATYPKELAELRAAMPHAWLLVPGFGSQGGQAADVAPAFDAHGSGAIVNNSRGIIFAHSRPEYARRFGASRWQEAVAAATQTMIQQLAECTTSSGKTGGSQC